jgi:photosystem II stability/assembly factor-like uncharacterized protein
MRCGARWANLRAWRSILPFLLAVILGVGCALRTTPTAPLPSPFAPLEWQAASAGLPAARPVLAFAADLTDPALMLAATIAPPQLYRSLDRGASWQPAGRELEGRLVHALLAVPETNGIFLAGASDGLFRSDDGGVTWRAIPDLPRPIVPPQGLERQGRSVYVLLAAADGALYLAGEDVRPWRSLDQGVTWQPLGALPAGAALLALAVSADGSRLLAGSDGAGLFSSDDGGQTWRQAADVPMTFVAGLWFDPADNRLAYARTRAGLYRSDDGGQRWQPVETEFEGRVDALLPGLKARQALLLTNAGQVYATDDSGRTWRLRGKLGRPGTAYGLWRLPSDAGATLIAATHAGLWRNDDKGGAASSPWQPWPHGPGPAAANDLARAADGALYLATPVGIYRSDDDGATWMSRSDGLPAAAVLSVAIAPSNPQVLYASIDGAGLYRSNDGGRTWVRTRLEVPSAPGILVDPADPDHLFIRAAYQRVYESRDGGETWRTPWDGLDLSTEIIALGWGPDAPSVLYAAGAEALYRSVNGGQSWQPMAAELSGQTVFQVAVDARDPKRLYAGATKGAYLSRDDGATWAPWGRGLEDVTVAALAFHPTRPQEVFAGSRYRGVYRSQDGGETWQPAGLEGASVYRLVVAAGGRWLIAVADRGVWRAPLAGGGP